MERRWTLETAREMLGEVRDRTARAVAAVEELDRRLEALAERPDADDAEERGVLARRLREELSRWMREMEALGVVVRGPWQVEFEAEAGAFCWRWPEPRIERFRGSDEPEPTPIQ
ncbi:MAG: DUF2203 family protein [Myxococcales bacterium]|nr:DUF2203 family protein [Myxococcales bacterium]